MAVPTRNKPPRMSGTDLFNELENVRASFGELTGETVVKAATPADSPLHSKFDWNDKSAAHKYRVEQGNELIRSVQIGYVDAEGAQQKVRGYVSVKRGERPAYEPTAEVAQNPVLAALTLQIAEREWRTLLARYGHLKEFIELVQATTPVAA